MVYYEQLTRIDSPENPCNGDACYSFRSCFANYVAERVGCHAPWLEAEAFEVPPCGNVTRLEAIFGQEWMWSQPFWPKMERMQKSKCPYPCLTHT